MQNESSVQEFQVRAFKLETFQRSPPTCSQIVIKQKHTFPVGQKVQVSIASSDKEANCRNKDAETLVISSWKQNLFIS